jgi:hypothetical protein
MNVHSLGALLHWPYAVAPVVIVGITSSRPAQHRHTKFFEVLDSLLSVSVDIGNGRFLPDPQTTIHASPQMLCEVSVKFWPDGPNLRV